MTFQKLLLTTALAGVTAVAAQADTNDTPDAEPERDATVDVPKADVDPDIDMPEATLTPEGDVMAPRALPMKGKDLDKADKTSVENIVREVENGATVNSVDDLIIGEAVSHYGEGAETMVHVDISEDADLAADRIAFEASTLTVERVAGLQYDYTLDGLREAVAERVAAMNDDMGDDTDNDDM